MKSIEYNSIFSELIQDFIDYKRAAGYKYESETSCLKEFDELCCSLNIMTPVITKELSDIWCTKKPHESERSSHQKRVSCIRQFALYLISSGYEAYIPVNLEYIQHRKSKYSAYIFSHEEMSRIFNTSNQVYPNRQSTMHLVMPVLIRLLYCTGLRVMEALKLQLKNVNLAEGTLLIESAKFNKDRLILFSKACGRS